jgi:hypothetical protein
LRARALAAAAALALAGAPLGAATFPFFGGQVALALPQGDLNGGKWIQGRTGLGAGLHATQSLDAGHALTLRADGTWIESGQVNILTGDGSSQLYAEDAKVRLFALCLEYNYFWSANPLEGPYFLLGFGESWMRQSAARLVPGGIGDPGVDWPSSSSASALQWSLGFGDKFSPRLGWEFRFSQATYHDVQIGGTSMKTPMFTLALTTDF